jgi:hypothetical protein
MNATSPSVEPAPVSLPRPEFSGPWLESPSSPPSSFNFAEIDEEEAPLPEGERLKLTERHDRLGPAAAGLLAGAIAGPLSLLTLDAAMLKLTALTPASASLAARFALTVGSEVAHPAAFLSASAAGAALGLGFTMLTRHLRRFAPLLAWALVVMPAVLTCFYAFVARPLAPTVLECAPFVPALVASLAFAFFVSLQLPVRRRHAPAFAREE